MRSLFIAAAGAMLLASPGCANKPTAKPFASIWRVRDELRNEMSDALHDARQQTSRTWSDIWRDWNYADQEAFGEVRSAAGHE